MNAKSAGISIAVWGLLTLIGTGCREAAPSAALPADTSLHSSSRSAVASPVSTPLLAESAGLLGSLRDSLRALKPEATSVRLLSIRSSLNFPGYLGIVLLRGKGFGVNPTTASGEVYALVHIDSTLSRFVSLIDTFPTGRGGDYDVWFQPSTSAFPLVICGQGESYGDQRMRREIDLSGDGAKAEAIRIEMNPSAARWVSAQGCGIRGTSSD